MEYRANITVRRPGGLTLDEDLDIQRQLDLRHAEFGAAGGGGTGDNAEYLLSTNRYDDPARAVAEMVAVVADAIAQAGITGAYPTAVELEPVDEPDARLICILRPCAQAIGGRANSGGPRRGRHRTRSSAVDAP